MKSRFVFILLSVLFLMGLSTINAQPLMKLAEQDFQFGITPQNAKLTHTFWIHSVGTDTLKIFQVKPGCGCTKAPIDKTELAPGDSTRLRITFSTRSYRGRVTKSPSISTNDGRRAHRIHIHANIVTNPDSTYPMIVTPLKPQLESTTFEKGNSLKLTFTNVYERDLHPKLVDTPPNVFMLDLPEVVPAGGKATASLRLTESARTNDVMSSFTIAIDDDEHTRFTIPIKWKSAPAINVKKVTAGSN